jgi:beta-lactamase regulating signal transducer with metallopeptidase domain
LGKDVFWFVPLMGALRRQILYALELAADAASARSNGAAVTASAILRVGEFIKRHAPFDTYGLGAMSDGALVRERIEILLRPRPRACSPSGLTHLAVSALVAVVMLTSALLGYR